MAPKVVNHDYKTIRAHTKESKAKVGLFRGSHGEPARRVKGGF